MSQLSNNSPIETNTSEKPQLCRMCCEFFGNQYMDNLCSKCFKQKSKTTPEKTALVTEEVLKTVQTISAPVEEQKTVEVAPTKIEVELEEPAKKVQTDPKKCFVCPKKTGALAYQCKCGFTYCKSHRLPEDHDCEFNFKQEAAKKLAKENPTIVASKLDKI